MSRSVSNSAGVTIVRRIFACLGVMLAAAWLPACERMEAAKLPIDLLIVGVLPGPTTYQVGTGPDASPDSVANGFEYDLIEQFAASQKFVTRYVVAKDAGALADMLRKKKIHLAAGMPISADSDLIFSAPIRESKQVLIGSDEDWSPDDLSGSTVEALAHSPQVVALQKLAGTPATFAIREVAGSSEQDLLERVASQKTALAASDMLNYRIAVNLNPDLVIVKELPDKVLSGWAFQSRHATLAKQADDFIATARKDGSLARLLDRYFGHIQRLKADGAARYIHDIHTVLPYYRKLFEATQASTGIDWRMIAALAYQESKWDPLATSFTNVRGMMMLTEDTADRLGVDNRLDPGQSIRAGGRYLSMLTEELPDDVPEPDRTWLALAAYNLGMGHLNGARTFARQLKRDPNSWYDMKKVLPLMSRPEYYSRLKAGPARGGEAVILVENVRNYYDILCRLEPAWQATTNLLGRKEAKAGSKAYRGVRIGTALNKDPDKAQLRLPDAAPDSLNAPPAADNSVPAATPPDGEPPEEPASVPPSTLPSPGAETSPAPATNAGPAPTPG